MFILEALEHYAETDRIAIRYHDEKVSFSALNRMADAFAAYKMKLQYPVTLQVNVKNLFDKTYYTSSIATNNLGNQIGDPREVQFTVKMEF